MNVNLLKVLANTKETAELVVMLTAFEEQLANGIGFAVKHAVDSIAAINEILEERGYELVGA